MAPSSATSASPPTRDTRRHVWAVFCPPSSGSADPAPQPPGHPPEANKEFPDWEEEPPSSLEAGGKGFPGILLHNGPAILQKAHGDGHWTPPRLRWGHQPLSGSPFPTPCQTFVSSSTLPWSGAARTLIPCSRPRCWPAHRNSTEKPGHRLGALTDLSLLGLVLSPSSGGCKNTLSSSMVGGHPRQVCWALCDSGGAVLPPP